MLIDERARVHFADLVAVGANDRYFSSTLALAAAKVLHAAVEFRVLR